MDPDLDLLKKQIELMALHAQSSMDPAQARAFEAATRKMQAEYEGAKRILADKNASAEAKKYAKDVTDAINKNLPNMVKGVLSAASAFKSGDYINGSAAIMDICAAGMQLIGSLSAGAGPYGAIFGALFSIVGQLLTYFGPKQPSLKDQIIEAMKGLNADEKLREVKANGSAVDQYMATIGRIKLDLSEILPTPLNTVENRVKVHKCLDSCIISINNAFTIISVLYDKWMTAEWLKDEKTQDLEKWPEILGVFCRTYADALLAHVLLESLVDHEMVGRQLEQASIRNPDYKNTPHEYDAIYDRLIRLEADMEALPKLWNDGNTQMLECLKAIEPVARDRGLFAHLGTNMSKNLYAATGGSVTRTGEWKPFQIGYGNRGRRFALTMPKTEAGSLKPRYHLFFCQHWSASDNGDMEHGWLDPTTLEVSDMKEVSGDKFHDVWALPSPDDSRASFVYTARNEGRQGSIKLHQLNDSGELKAGNWQPATKAGVVNVRAITHPPATLPDDPDGAAMLPALLQGTDHYNSIMYGALAASGELYVDQSNTRCYVPAPWGSYTGIDVDPYYVWVFGPMGLACATHASVISCIRGIIKSPRWISHIPEALIGDTHTHPGKTWRDRYTQARIPYPPLIGIQSLSPCKDGTLFASITTRTVTAVQHGGEVAYIATDTPALYTALYSINIKDGRLNVGPWSKLPGGPQAQQVQKMAIPCWSLFASLKAQLAKTPVMAPPPLRTARQTTL
ncbi:hypothetical protein [Janthinobacterium sp. NKUCC08_JDC]|uniref:hypothetical protein n=1 Tax=Janthinobacterium sp. NKUCC08_JDC TaxID=2842122 RepID=UPI001C5A79B6|nr:hypothetical protein [Janthinobacterium sp. NKUCC08_JDC]MBW3500818.1 hypothetical protein [Janthinobacterium sp. NKUCC08_JDC]